MGLLLKSGEGKVEQDVCLAAKLQLSSKSKHCKRFPKWTLM